MHLKVTQILYSMHIIIMFLYFYMIFGHQFTVQILQTVSQSNTTLDSCGYFNPPIFRAQRQPILQHTLACTSLVLGLAQLFNLNLGHIKNLTSLPSSLVSDCSHSGLTYTRRRAPDSSVITLPPRCRPHSFRYIKCTCMHAPSQLHLLDCPCNEDSS